MFKLNGNPLLAGRPFSHNGIQYPANWLNAATPEEKAAIGIVEVADKAPVDYRFYWNANTPKALNDVEEVDENGDPAYVKVLDNSDPENPVMVDSEERLVTRGLKWQWTQQVKETAGKLMAPTDWMVTRKSELGTAIPADVVTKRAAIRTECDRLEAAIAAAANIDAFIAVVSAQNWPE